MERWLSDEQPGVLEMALGDAIEYRRPDTGSCHDRNQDPDAEICAGHPRG